MKAVIAGATGLVGSLLISKLLKNSSFSQVISLSRRPLPFQNAKLDSVILSDFAQIPSQAERLQGDVYFCCLGTTIKDAGSPENFRKVDFDAIVTFGQLAQANSARCLVVISAMGANSRSLIFYNRVKGETEEALQALHLPSLVIWRPGLLLGSRSQVRRGENVASRALQILSPFLPQQLEKRLATNAEHLAERMMQAGLEARPGLQIISSGHI